MLKELKEISLKHQQLAEKLADPKLIQRRDEYTKINKEYQELSDIVELFRKYQKKSKELDGANEMAETETDPELRDLAESEIKKLEDTLEVIEQELKTALTPPDPFDGKNIILEIRAGTGGAEAGLFAADLFRMYSRFAEKKDWKVEILSISYGELDGIKEVIALISGKHVYGDLKYESGVHRVQRVPVTEASGRIHTSAVTVAVLPEAEDVEIDIDPADIRVDVYRSSGPGGQSVNTTDSAVRIMHIPTGMVVTCQDEKSQHKNKAKALKILKSRLLDKARQEQEDRIAKERRLMVSTGDRSAKIRTYNFPQNRVSDHRINLTLHRLNYILEGDLEELSETLKSHFQTENIKQRSST
ncbi:peptide chain release factor 1 [bacterium]|nr:peptide chain release factor 1 [candidate division CSSED10-310 bacterium]